MKRKINLISVILLLILPFGCKKGDLGHELEFTLTEFVLGVKSAEAKIILEELELYEIEISGLVYSISPIPELGDMVFEAEFVDNIIEVKLEGLEENTKYYARAFVTVDDGYTFYSEQAVFITLCSEVLE